jgi:hypothetical protein
MKILSYTGYRTGSRSLGDWLSTELSLPYYHEPFNKNITIPSMIVYKDRLFKNFTIEKSGDSIIKISPEDGFDYEDLKKLFDKKIILYRENTKEQAESILWANEKQLWHNTLHSVSDNNIQSNAGFVSAHYTIPMDWLNKNKKEIQSTEKSLQKQNEILKSLTDCLHITYEELYYSNTGIKKIEDYIGFKSKSTFNKIHKLRNGEIKLTLI